MIVVELGMFHHLIGSADSSTNAILVKAIFTSRIAPLSFQLIRPILTAINVTRIAEISKFPPTLLKPATLSNLRQNARA